MGKVGRDPWRSFSPTSLLKQGSLKHFTQHFLELWLQLLHCSDFSLVITAVQDRYKGKIGCKPPFFSREQQPVWFNSWSIYATDPISIYFFTLLMFSLGYAITSQLLSTTVDKHSLPSIWGVSWLWLNVGPYTEFHLIFSGLLNQFVTVCSRKQSYWRYRHIFTFFQGHRT